MTTVAILSIGDMGMGLARLLVAHGFRVTTTTAGRSQDTTDRARAASVAVFDTDADLVHDADVVLSVVPPRDALATAQRVADAVARGGRDAEQPPLVFADLNAVSPTTSRKVAALFDATSVHFVDGCILGGPPQLATATPAPGTVLGTGGDADADFDFSDWYRPLVPTSGPHTLDAFAGLAATLNSRHIGPDVGAASGLKMCFAALSKGYAAIAVQSFTAAQRLGVLPALQDAMRTLVPGRVAPTEGALVGMAPKAYRWVREMEEISATFVDAGFGPELFAGAADVFRAVADDTVLGQEKIGRRQRGQTAEDVAAAMAEGLAAKQDANA